MNFNNEVIEAHTKGFAQQDIKFGILATGYF